MTDTNIAPILAAIRDAMAQPALYGAARDLTYQEAAVASACSPANMAKLLDHVDALETRVTATLPCEVLLPPATRISAGCSVQTLLTAIERRQGVAPQPFTVFDRAEKAECERDEARGNRDFWNGRAKELSDQVDALRAEVARLSEAVNENGRLIVEKEGERAELAASLRDARVDLRERDATIARLRGALTKIDARRYGDRQTVSESNAWPAFQSINRELCAIYDEVRTALASAPAAVKPPADPYLEKVRQMGVANDRLIAEMADEFAESVHASKKDASHE